MTETSRNPPCTWYQDFGKAYIWVRVPDLRNVHVEFTENEVHFLASPNYNMRVLVFAPINIDKSSYSTETTCVKIQLTKQTPQWWDSIYVPDRRLANIKFDWTKFIENRADAEMNYKISTELEKGNDIQSATININPESMRNMEDKIKNSFANHRLPPGAKMVGMGPDFNFMKHANIQGINFRENE